jgi:Tol biopolymer transport system component
LYVSVSPDGERLAVINLNKKKTLRLVPTRGGETRVLLTYEDSRIGFTPLEWTADGKHILFTRTQPAKDGLRYSLWRISADGGEPQELGLEMANFDNLSVHPDGVRLAFCSAGSTLKSPSVWAMENFLPPAPARPAPVTMTARMIEDPPGDTPNCRVSPDGRYLTFVDWDKNNVFVRDLQTGKDRQLTDEGEGGDEFQGAGATAAWSSDGKKIAYAWSFRRGRTLIRRELRVVGVDGGKPRILAEFKGTEGGKLIWSPDEKYLATTLYPENGSPGIVLISTEDGSVRRLTDLKREIWPTNQVFSPDSRHIAYDRLPDENSPERDIYLVSVETGQDIPLVRHPADDYLLGWSRDGKWLVFASDRTGALGLWVVGVSGTKTEGEPKLVKPGIDRILPVGMTRDGALYYGLVRAAEDIFIVDLDPRTGMVAGPPGKAIEQFEGGNFTPAYSPDGKYMAYVSRRGNSPYPTNVGNALCIRSLDSGQERVFYKEVWKLGFRLIGGANWSPNGRFIAFSGSGGISGGAGVYRVDLETGEITPVVQGGPDQRLGGCAYRPDGKYIFVRGKIDEGFIQIVARDLDSGEEQELYRVPKLDRISTALSPDGRWLSFINMGWGGVRSLKIMPASGGEAREIWNFGEVKQGVPGISHTWSSDGRYILLAAPDFADLRAWYLWRVPVEGGMPPENMGLEWEKWGIWDLTAHPDGTKLAFAGRGAPSDASELWVLENFLPR